MNENIKKEWLKYELNKDQIKEEINNNKLPNYINEIVFKKINAPWNTNEIIYIENNNNSKNSIVPLYGSFMEYNPLYDQFFLLTNYLVYVEGNKELNTLDYNGIYSTYSKQNSIIHIIPIKYIEKIEITFSSNRKGKIEGGFKSDNISPLMNSLLIDKVGGSNGAILNAQLNSNTKTGTFNLNIYDLHIKLKDCPEYIKEGYCAINLEQKEQYKETSIKVYNEYLSKINTEEWNTLKPINTLVPDIVKTNNKTKGLNLSSPKTITNIITFLIITFILLMIFLYMKNNHMI